jgi:hypothetical protein
MLKAVFSGVMLTYLISGKINVGGADSPLKQALLEMKKVESGNFLPKQTLLFEIEGSMS